MSRKRIVTKDVKRRILLAYEKGATEPQIKKYAKVGTRAIYDNTSQEERDNAREEHDNSIKNIFKIEKISN